ncbi:MAG TPA: hypothetical protein PK359_14990 [Burkholderiaceae bacterium]|jgi:hypothetical protein|nr:hypothetical protein [Burkholderiaceae bacterium]
MFYALSWFVVASLLALWALVAWALHAVTIWTVSHAGELKSGASGSGALTLPDWVTSWVPAEIAQWVSQMLASLGPVVDRLIEAAPALATGVTVAAWTIWGIGSVLLVLLGAGLHLLISLGRRTDGNATRAGAGSSRAAG